MADKHIKRFSTSLVNMEMQMKTQQWNRYCTNLMGKISLYSIDESVVLGGEGSWWECKLVQLRGRAIWEYLTNFKVSKSKARQRHLGVCLS